MNHSGGQPLGVNTLMKEVLVVQPRGITDRSGHRYSFLLAHNVTSPQRICSFIKRSQTMPFKILGKGTFAIKQEYLPMVLQNTFIGSEFLMQGSAQCVMFPCSTFSILTTRKISGCGFVTEKIPWGKNDFCQIFLCNIHMAVWQLLACSVASTEC